MAHILKRNETGALRYIRNQILHTGTSPSVRDVQRALKCRSSRTALIAINGLIEQGYLRRRQDGSLRLLSDLPQTNREGHTVDVPLVGSVACGMPILAEENIEAIVSVSESLARPGARYFLLRAVGDSMNRAGINDGDLLLVRQQSVANDGDRVVALINDEATVKEYFRGREAIVLRPRSTDSAHRPIVLTEDFRVQGVVVATLPRLD